MNADSKDVDNIGDTILDVDEHPVTRPIERMEATGRNWLTMGLLLLVFATVAASFVSLMWGPGIESTTRWLDIILPSEVTLLAASTAFFFATKK